MPGKRYDRQFKLSAARLVLEGEIPVKGLSDQLNVPCCTLRRWAAEYEADGEDAFPGSGNPVANKDYEMLKLKKENEELRKEVAILKKFRAFSRQAQARGSSSRGPASMGWASRGHAGRWASAEADTMPS